MDDLFPHASPILVTYDLLPFVDWLKAQYPEVLQEIQLYGSVADGKYELIHSGRIYPTVENFGLDLTWQSDGLLNINQFCRKCGYGGNREGENIVCFNAKCASVIAGPGQGIIYASLQDRELVTSKIEAMVSFDALANIIWAQQMFEALSILEKVLVSMQEWVPKHKYKTLAQVAL